MLLQNIYRTQVNHRVLFLKLLNTMQNSALCRVNQNLLSNKKVCVELNNEQSRRRLHMNGLPQGSVFSPTLNIYTNDQSVHDETRSFIYADDLCIAAQYFSQVESTIEEALGELKSITETTVCVLIMTRSKSQRFIYRTERQRDN